MPSVGGVTLSHLDVTSTRISATATVEPGAGAGAQGVVMPNPTDAGHAARLIRPAHHTGSAA